MTRPPLSVDLNAKPAGTTVEAWIKQVAGGENKAAKYGPRHVRCELNKTETAYAMELDARKHAGEVLWYLFEPVTFYLAKGLRFTPDFWVCYSHAGGYQEFVDVKGAKAAIQDKATVKIKMAAAVYPMFRWSQAIKVKGGFERREF